MRILRTAFFRDRGTREIVSDEFSRENYVFNQPQWDKKSRELTIEVHERSYNATTSQYSLRFSAKEVSIMFLTVVLEARPALLRKLLKSALDSLYLVKRTGRRK